MLCCPERARGAGELKKPRFRGFLRWPRLGSNQRPLACEICRLVAMIASLLMGVLLISPCPCGLHRLRHHRGRARLADMSARVHVALDAENDGTSADARTEESRRLPLPLSAEGSPGPGRRGLRGAAGAALAYARR